MKLTKTKLKEIIREVITEVSTLGTSGLKSFAKKHKYSVKSKKSGGRVPLMYLSKGGKDFGPFDPTITTKRFLLKKLGLKEDAPKGWEGTVKAMKKEKDIDNPYALAHWMKNKGYKSHKPE